MKSKFTNIEEQVREYYRNARLELPQYSSWRVYKFRLFNGSFIQLTQISSIKEFRRQLIKHAPCDVWFSSCLFISPKHVNGKKDKSISNNLMIGGDIVFDIDSDNLENAKLKAIQLIKRINKVPQRITFSGGKGFHIVYGTEFFSTGNPFKNMQEYNHSRKSIIELYNLKGLIDEDVTTDEYRIIRAPLTVHMSGRVAINLETKDLYRSIDFILSKSSNIHAPLKKEMLNNVEESEKSGDERAAHPTTYQRTSLVDIRELSNIFSQEQLNKAQYIQYETKSTVMGVHNRVVPFLIYNNKSYKKDLYNLSYKYNIGSWYAFIYIVDNKVKQVALMSLRAIPMERAIKLYRDCSAINKMQLSKFKTTWIKLKRINRDLSEEKIMIHPITIFEDKEKLYSSTHRKLLENFGINVTEEGKFIGSSEPKINMVLLR